MSGASRRVNRDLRERTKQNRRSLHYADLVEATSVPQVKSGMNSTGSSGTGPGAPCSRQRTWDDYEFFKCFAKRVEAVDELRPSFLGPYAGATRISCTLPWTRPRVRLSVRKTA
jgi:hypothetical protein